MNFTLFSSCSFMGPKETKWDKASKILPLWIHVEGHATFKGLDKLNYYNNPTDKRVG